MQYEEDDEIPEDMEYCFEQREWFDKKDHRDNCEPCADARGDYEDNSDDFK